MAPTSGILYVTMQPRDTLAPARFHDWYNNEHGPGRLRLPFCANGFRYRATDLNNGQGTEDQPEWMAIYDIEDMDYLTKDVYTRLRLPPVQSHRERDTMKEIKVDRRFYDFVSERKVDAFPKLEDVQREGEGNVLIFVAFTLNGGKENEEELRKWYEDEHIAMLSKVPGWRRSRRFVTSSLEPEREKEWVAIHEYAPQNGIGGKEFEAATTTPWKNKVFTEVAKTHRRRAYNLYYTFGPAPRDLESLTSKDTFPVTFAEDKTKTFPASSGDGNGNGPAIESFVTTPDGVEIPYRLEGSSDPSAPLIVLANSILVEWGIWDDFVAAFLKLTNNKYRVLRFHTRGRSSLPPSSTSPVTVDLLAKDIITLLDALRVKKAEAVVGVSLGGATALNVGLKYPNRIVSFIACDTNSLAPPGNPKAWGERIAMAEKEGLKSASGEPIVGEELAEITVRRWAVKESYESSSLLPKLERTKEFVKTNSLDGFKRSVEALYKYDFRDEMKTFKGKGAFLVGAGDGVLPKTMKDMADGLGSGAELKIIEGAGHLPMVEKPDDVAAFVKGFLEK